MRPISGTFEGNLAFALDTGVAIGLYKEPFMIVGKISYPVFRSGKSEDLRKKSSNGSVTFPSDFVQYSNGEVYHALSNKIDGLKITLSFMVAPGIF